MISAHVIPLPTELLYCLHEGDHWTARDPFETRKKATHHIMAQNLSLEYELPNMHVHTFAFVHIHQFICK